MEEEFRKDFIRVMLEVSMLASRYNVPKPTVVFGPEWKSKIMMSFSRGEISFAEHYSVCNIKFDFGRFENEQVIFRRM